jgi:hypothetical protein
MGRKKIAMIASIAKIAGISRSLPLINTDDTDQRTTQHTARHCGVRWGHSGVKRGEAIAKPGVEVG